MSDGKIVPFKLKTVSQFERLQTEAKRRGLSVNNLCSHIIVTVLGLDDEENKRIAQRGRRGRPRKMATT